MIPVLGEPPELERYPDSELMGMSIDVISATYSIATAGLDRRLFLEVNKRFAEGSDRDLVLAARGIALALHQEDRRDLQPYNNHLLRVALGSMLDYGLNDPELAAAGLMHASIEDHADDLVDEHDRQRSQTEKQFLAAELVEKHLSAGVRKLVSEVTGPPESIEGEPGVYSAHITNLVRNGGPRSLLLQVTGFIDNGVGGVIWCGPRVAPNLAEEYRQVFPILRRAVIQRPDLPVTPEVRQQILNKLDLGINRVKMLLGES